MLIALKKLSDGNSSLLVFVLCMQQFTSVHAFMSSGMFVHEKYALKYATSWQLTEIQCGVVAVEELLLEA